MGALLSRDESPEAHVDVWSHEDDPCGFGAWRLGRALSKSNLKKLRATVPPERLLAFSDHLTKSPTAWHVLQDLTLIVSGNGFGWEGNVRAAAQAIGTLHGLRKLTLQVEQRVAISFLWALSQSSPLTIQEVALTFPEGTALSSEVAHALASFLTNAKKLQDVELYHCSCSYAHFWRILATALETNPTIDRFTLQHATFSSDATTAFLNGMHSNRHAIRTLRLFECQFRLYPQTTGVDFANMLCGSQLKGVGLDHGVVSPNQIARFFATLSAKVSTVRLRSMFLDLLYDNTMTHPIEHWLHTWLVRST
jgi:hypothetical protein